jgi:phosphoribosylanthranilate isomerase
MSVRVKICGLACLEDVQATAALAPDYLGFIFWPHSKRAVDAESVAEWTRNIPGSVKKVGVFVDAGVDEINTTCRTAGLDIVQLHSDEPPDLCAQVDGAVWKVVHIDQTTAKDVAHFPVEAFLIDSYTAASPGGTGLTVDWHKAADFIQASGQHVFLAGGLKPGNVAEAISSVRPWGVDVSSGVELHPGRKDMEKVKQFIEASRA